MTHLDGETNTLYVNDGERSFSDASARAGSGRRAGRSPASARHGRLRQRRLARPARGRTARSARSRRRCAPADPIRWRSPTSSSTTRAAAASRRSRERRRRFARAEVGRGAAFGDVDNDGDTDVVVANNSGPARAASSTRSAARRPGSASRWSADGGRTRRARRRGRASSAEAGAGSRRVRATAATRQPRPAGAGRARRGGRGGAVRVRWPRGAVEEFAGLVVDRYQTLTRAARGSRVARDRPALARLLELAHRASRAGSASLLLVRARDRGAVGRRGRAAAPRPASGRPRSRVDGRAGAARDRGVPRAGGRAGRGRRERRWKQSRRADWRRHTVSSGSSITRTGGPRRRSPPTPTRADSSRAPTVGPTTSGIARAVGGRSRRGAARALERRARVLAPGDRRTSGATGRAGGWSQRRLDDAERLFRHVLERESDSAAAWFGLGQVAAERRDASCGDRGLRARALSCSPRPASLTTPLALAYRDSGDAERAQGAPGVAWRERCDRAIRWCASSPRSRKLSALQVVLCAGRGSAGGGPRSGRLRARPARAASRARWTTWRAAIEAGVPTGRARPLPIRSRRRVVLDAVGRAAGGARTRSPTPARAFDAGARGRRPTWATPAVRLGTPDAGRQRRVRRGARALRRRARAGSRR